MKTVAACLAVVCLLAGGAAAGRLTAASGSQPPCPHPSYGADGNMAPLFCVIDNPLALRYYAKDAPHLFALGPNANPQQVVAAAVADRPKAATIPTLCAAYRLIAWRDKWQFGISPAAEIGTRLRLYAGWCSEPRFNVSN